MTDKDDGQKRGLTKAAPLPAEWLEDIKRAVDAMNRGGVIVYPTDTIWGIGCDAANEEAVRHIFEIKHRADSKALITLVDSEARIQHYVRCIPDVAWDLIDCAVRPLTIVYDGGRNLAPNLLAEDGSIGLRMTQEPFSRELCRRMKRAVVSTSANVSGRPSPHCFAEISEEILSAADYVCTSRRDESGPGAASTIIRLTESAEVSIIRP